MNVDSVFTAPLSPIVPSKASQSVSEDSLGAKQWSLQLRSLHVLAKHILSNEEAPLFQLIEQLNHFPIHFASCKKHYLQAYLTSFSEAEKEIYLHDFFEHFDPKKEILCLSHLSWEDKNQLWEGVLHYFCAHYLDFPTQAEPLMTLFEKLDPAKVSLTKQTEKKLDHAFDQGLNFLLDYAKPAGRLIEPKVLFLAYLARFMAQLEKAELQNEDHFVHLKQNIDSLFEELYFYLLSMPYPVTFEIQSGSLLEQIKQVALKENKELLNEKFIEQLISLLKKHPNVCLDEEMEDCLKVSLMGCNFFKNT